MSVYLASFATSNFYKSQKKLAKSAKKFGVDHCLSFTHQDIRKSDFYQENKTILDQERGAGYWLWKPYIILETMKQAKEDDIIIYCDSGVEVVQSLQPLIDMCLKQKGLLLFRVHSQTGKHINKKWTKRDCFIILNADTEEYHLAEQVTGTFQFFMKNRKNLNFIEEWFSYCKDPRLLSDTSNTLGYRNYPEFIDHRHDQSILSILAKKQNLEIFRDPSQYGDQLKNKQFRIKGELKPGLDYSPRPYLNSPYGTLFNHHRERSSLISLKISRLFRKPPKSPHDGLNIFPLETTAPPQHISIGITTFENRFHAYFVPLLNKIREYDTETEIIVAINGEHKQEFSEEYRENILQFLATQEKIFPVMFPRFRGVAKLWNTIIINATHDHILILNDDIDITDQNFLKIIKENIRKNKTKSFTINNSWSHFLLNRDEIDYLGYFDERLLGIGEEDGDIIWRYFQEFRKLIANFSMKCFKNFADESVHSYKPLNIKCHSNTKYSLFNRNFMFKQKYTKDTSGIKGIFDYPVTMKDQGPPQYVNERFYRKNKDKL